MRLGTVHSQDHDDFCQRNDTDTTSSRNLLDSNEESCENENQEEELREFTSEKGIQNTMSQMVQFVSKLYKQLTTTYKQLTTFIYMEIKKFCL